jgi:hypothetical protein
MQKQTDIFISYRRDGGDMTAMYIYQALKDRGYDVFYDVEVLRSGKFNEALLEYIRSCKDFIVVLSPHALDRCDDENDWVRQEIAEAIKQKKNIIPVMMNGFNFPESLPEEIDSLRYHTGLTSSTEYFQESMNRLCEKFLTAQPRKKRKWLLPVAVVGAVIIALLVINIITMRSKPTTTEPTTEVAAPMSTETPEETIELEAVTAANNEPDDTHTIISYLAVMPKEMEEQSSILCDDWMFTLPYENSWTIEYVNGPDLDAYVADGQFCIGRLPSQEGTTEYKATRYGTDYKIILEARVPDTLPEDAVLLDQDGVNLNEQEITVKAGEKVAVDCHFIPETWRYLDQEQIAEIWCENGNADALAWECDGTTGEFSITEPGQYKIGVKVNSGHVVAYRFINVTVE